MDSLLHAGRCPSCATRCANQNQCRSTESNTEGRKLGKSHLPRYFLMYCSSSQLASPARWWRGPQESQQCPCRNAWGWDHEARGSCHCTAGSQQVVEQLGVRAVGGAPSMSQPSPGVAGRSSTPNHRRASAPATASRAADACSIAGCTKASVVRRQQPAAVWEEEGSRSLGRKTCSVQRTHKVTGSMGMHQSKGAEKAFDGICTPNTTVQATAAAALPAAVPAAGPAAAAPARARSGRSSAAH